ncbi:MAG TPA: sensor domain-containing protein [Actinomycetes bacterium]
MAATARGEAGRARLLGSALLATLLAPLALALLALALVAAVAVPVGVGVPLALGVLAAVRGFTGLHRRRVARILGTAVERPYRPAAGGGLVARLRRAAGDPATWRDLAWLPLDATVGVVLRLASLALLLGGLGCLAFPLFWPALPASAQPYWVGLVPVGDQAGANLVPLQGVVVLLLWWGLTPWLMRMDALLTRALLAPTERSRLTSRVRELAQTRAETVDTQAAELRRIERDLHDGVQARLVALGMSLGMAEEAVARDPEAARSLLAEAQRSTGQALAELRQVVRGIHPPVLADRGIDGAVRALALRGPLPTEVEIDLPDGRLPPPVESAAYFAVAEALTNVAKHSQATRAWVRLRHAHGRLRVEVGDDGKGGADPGGGSGLRGIRRRLAPFDGTLELASPPGGPTILTMELPCESSSPRTSPSSGTA